MILNPGDHLRGRAEGVCGRALGHPGHNLFNPSFLFTNYPIFTSTLIPLIIFGSGHQESSHSSFYAHVCITISFLNVPQVLVLPKSSQLALKCAFCHKLTQVSCLHWNSLHAWVKWSSKIPAKLMQNSK